LTNKSELAKEVLSKCKFKKKNLSKVNETEFRCQRKVQNSQPQVPGREQNKTTQLDTQHPTKDQWQPQVVQNFATVVLLW